jgi:hypothetical protein
MTLERKREIQRNHYKRHRAKYLEKRRINKNRIIKAMVKPESTVGKTWIVLYKKGCIFSPPMPIDPNEVDGYRHMNGKIGLEVRVVNPRKAAAIQKHLSSGVGTVHAVVIDGVHVEALYPASIDSTRANSTKHEIEDMENELEEAV